MSHLISTPGGPVDSEAGTSTPQRAGTMEVPELQRMSSLAPPQDGRGDLGRFLVDFLKVICGKNPAQGDSKLDGN